MALKRDDVALLRKEFPALDGKIGGKPVVFFDGPGGTQVHKSVPVAMLDYFENACSNAHGLFEYSKRTDRVVAEAREHATYFLNAPDLNCIVFGPNMTSLTFRFSQTIGATLKPGDEIIVTRLDHDANVAPWLALRDHGISIQMVDFDPHDCTLDMEDYERKLADKTCVVAVGLAANSVGTINDVKRIADLAHQRGALVYVDAVHYAPHICIDVQALNCDFLVCSAYKFFGPHAGILFGKRHLLEKLHPPKVRPAPESVPSRFETGTGNFEAIAGTTAAIRYIATIGERFGQEWLGSAPNTRDRIAAGMHAVKLYESELCRYLITALLEIPQIKIYGITDFDKLQWRVPTVSFTMNGYSPQEIAMRLNRENIFAWDGHFYAVNTIEKLGLDTRGGVLRVGLCHYNTYDEIDLLIRCLRNMK